MAGSKRTRNRTERLCPAAISRVEAAIVDEWAQQGGTRRLTQAARAELLGLSIPTTDKLMRGEPVDRNALKDALRKIGVEWSEAIVVGPEPDPGVVKEEALRTPKQKWIVRMILGATGAACLAAIAWMIPGALKESPDHWMVDFDRLFLQIEREYNAAQYGQARITAERAIQEAHKHRSSEKMSNALFMAGKIESANGSLDQARSLYEQSLTLRVSFKDDYALPPILERLGDVETQLGMLNEAEAHFTAALDGFRKQGRGMGIAEAERGLGTVRYRERRFARALTHYKASLEAIPNDQRADFEADIRGLRALVYSAQGDHALARTELQQSMNHWKDKGHPRWIASTELKLARIELRASNSSVARGHLANARRGYQSAGDKTGLLEVSELEAQFGE